MADFREKVTVVYELITQGALKESQAYSKEVKDQIGLLDKLDAGSKEYQSQLKLISAAQKKAVDSLKDQNTEAKKTGGLISGLRKNIAGAVASYVSWQKALELTKQAIADAADFGELRDKILEDTGVIGEANEQLAISVQSAANVIGVSNEDVIESAKQYAETYGVDLVTAIDQYILKTDQLSLVQQEQLRLERELANSQNDLNAVLNGAGSPINALTLNLKKLGTDAIVTVLQFIGNLSGEVEFLGAVFKSAANDIIKSLNSIIPGTKFDLKPFEIEIDAFTLRNRNRARKEESLRVATESISQQQRLKVAVKNGKSLAEALDKGAKQVKAIDFSEFIDFSTAEDDKLLKDIKAEADFYVKELDKAFAEAMRGFSIDLGDNEDAFAEDDSAGLFDFGGGRLEAITRIAEEYGLSTQSILENTKLLQEEFGVGFDDAILQFERLNEISAQYQQNIDDAKEASVEAYGAIAESAVRSFLTQAKSTEDFKKIAIQSLFDVFKAQLEVVYAQIRATIIARQVATQGPAGLLTGNILASVVIGILKGLVGGVESKIIGSLYDGGFARIEGPTGKGNYRDAQGRKATGLWELHEDEYVAPRRVTKSRNPVIQDAMRIIRAATEGSLYAGGQAALSPSSNLLIGGVQQRSQTTEVVAKVYLDQIDEVNQRNSELFDESAF